jgi:Fur family transcriptional regulator, ferric uptake regulator
MAPVLPGGGRRPARVVAGPSLAGGEVETPVGQNVRDAVHDRYMPTLGAGAAAADGDDATAVRAAGLRWTPQRQLILQVLREAGDQHMTAEEVWRAVSEQYAGLNRSTVYRVLEALTGIGLVRQTFLGGDTAHFELEGRAHHHLVCSQCRQIVEIPENDLASLGRRLLQRHGFHLGGSPLTIEGVCADCYDEEPPCAAASGPPPPRRS